MLQEATGASWVLSVGTGGAPTITEAEDRRRRLTAEVEQHPLMQAIRDAFPEAKIEQIRTRAEITRPPRPRPCRNAGRGRHARGLGPVRGLMPPVAAKRGRSRPHAACDARPRGVSG
jgi:hypothetical protein